jgi:Excreted virulence factor EspC, type VII ESX diderm
MAVQDGSTPAGQGYTVITGGLRDHAAALGQVAGVLGQALGSAQQVTLADQAYGQLPICSAFAGLVKAVAQPGIAVLTQAQSTVTSTGDRVTKMAANYDVTEQNNAGRFQRNTR